MKKLIALFVALLLLYAVPASAAQWADGRSPQQPYLGVPAVDFTQTLGYMMFYPNAKMDVGTGVRTLFVYLPREDVYAGSGELTLRTQEDRDAWTIAFNDTQYVHQREMVEDELVSMQWGSGTCFEITLPVSVKIDRHYYVDLARDCIISNDNTVSNPARDGEETWSFDTKSEYGVSEMSYRRMLADGSYEEGIVNPQPGDEIRFDLVLGGEAKTAALFQLSGANFTTASYTESAEVIGSVTEDDPAWGVLFLDASGNQIAQITF